MITFIVEDGTGLLNATSYASIEESNTYNTNYLYGGTWDDQSDDDKMKSLNLATLQIDLHCDFYGVVRLDKQSLAFPRSFSYPSDAALLDKIDSTLLDNQVPQQIKNATSEFARALTTTDRVADSTTGIISSMTLDSLSVSFNTSTLPTTSNQIVPANVFTMLNIFLGSGRFFTRVKSNSYSSSPILNPVRFRS